MGQKISPTSFRVGINKDWASRWFGGRKYKDYLKADLKVRTFLEKKLKNMGVDRIELERGNDSLNVIIYTSRPGFLIGRGGTGVEELREEASKEACGNSICETGEDYTNCPADCTAPTTGEPPIVPVKERSTAWLWILLLVIVIALILYVVMRKRKK